MSLLGFTRRQKALLVVTAVVLVGSVWALYEANPLAMADWWSRGGVAFVLAYVVVFVTIRVVARLLDVVEAESEEAAADSAD